MEKEALIKRFRDANLKLTILDPPKARTSRDRIFGGGRGFAINIINRGTKNESFTVVWGENIKNIQALGTLPIRRQLVLFVEMEDTPQETVKIEKINGVLVRTVKALKPIKTKRRFLCGYDEREYFIASLPPSSNATTVEQAFKDLKPGPVIIAGQKQSGVLRQGEWFFIPAPHFNPSKHIIHKNEPIVRAGGGKPHVCEQLVRTSGGKSVTFKKGEMLPTGKIAVIDQAMTLVSEVYVTGKVKHPDHETKKLSGWYQVLMNTERGIDGQVMRFFD